MIEKIKVFQKIFISIHLVDLMKQTNGYRRTTMPKKKKKTKKNKSKKIKSKKS